MSPHPVGCVCPECELDREIDRAVDHAVVLKGAILPLRRGWNPVREREEVHEG